MRRRTGKKQRVEWSRTCVSVSSSGAAVNVVLVGNAVITDLTAPTLIRTRGGLIAYSTAAVPASDVIAVGLIVTTEDAGAAGVVPDPTLDGDADWFYHSYMPSRPTTESTGTYWREIVDVKAMRRINQDEVIVLVARSCNAAAFALHGGLSFLLKQV